MAVTVEILPPIRVAYVHHVGPMSEIADAFSTLMEWAALAGVDVEDEQVLVVSHDDPATSRPDEQRYDAAITVQQDVEATSQIAITTIGDREYVVGDYAGPYAGIADAYRSARRDASDMRITLDDGPNLEFLVDVPQSPDDIDAVIYLPMKIMTENPEQ